MPDRCVELIRSNDSFDWKLVRRQLSREFSLVETNLNLARWRERRRLEKQLNKLKSLCAPEVILNNETERIRTGRFGQVAQALVYDDIPRRAVLDLTVREDSIVAYYAPGDSEFVRRCARLLAASIRRYPFEKYDERGSDSERKYWETFHDNRAFVAARLSALQGAEALWQGDDGRLSRVCISNWEINSSHFVAEIQVIATPGLWNGLRQKGVSWRWGEFSRSECCWIRGPHIIEKLFWGEAVAAVTNYCRQLDGSADADDHDHRRIILSILRET